MPKNQSTRRMRAWLVDLIAEAMIKANAKTVVTLNGRDLARAVSIEQAKQRRRDIA